MNADLQADTPTSNSLPFHQVRRWQKTVLYALLCLGPVLFVPDALVPNSIDTPRRLLLLLGGGLLAASALRIWSYAGKLEVRRSRLDTGLALLVGAALIAGLFSEYPSLSFWGPVWSRDGLPFLATGVLQYLGIRVFLSEACEVRYAVAVSLLAGGMVALIGLLDYTALLDLHLPISGLRLTGTMGNPMFTGAYIAALLPLAVPGLVMARTSRVRLLMILCVVLLATALVCTYTRAAWVGAFSSLAFVLLLLWRTDRGAALRRAAASMAVSVLLTVLLVMAVGKLHDARYPARSPAEWARSSANVQDLSYQQRVAHMQAAWRMFLARPLVGWGPGTSAYITPQYRSADVPAAVRSRLNRGHVIALPHSLPLQIAAEMGIVGVVAAVLVVIAFFRIALQVAKSGGEKALLATGLMGLFMSHVVSGFFGINNAATLAQFWVAVGLMAVLAGTGEEAREGVPGSLLIGVRGRMILRSMSVAVAILVVTSVCAQFLAGFYLYRGMQGIEGLERIAAENPARAEEQSFLCIADIMRSIDLTPVPTVHGRLIFGDPMSWSSLSLAYRSQSRIFVDIVSIAGAHSLMVQSAGRALDRLDRDPILGDLAVEQLRYNELVEARRTVDALLAVAPNSAEVHLLDAHLCEKEGRFHQAVRAAQLAVQLDPSFREASLMLVRLRSQ